LETAQRLAEEYKVGEATIRRDGKFTEAVDSIAENCGEKAKHAILARDAGLSRGAVVRLAKLKLKDQQKAVQELLEKGKLPRKTRARKRSTITLPTEPKSLAEKLFQGLGAKGSSEVLEALSKLLEGQEQKE
jgi:DNA-binding MurR/RpiR family transcriptional regulator